MKDWVGAVQMQLPTFYHQSSISVWLLATYQLLERSFYSSTRFSTSSLDRRSPHQTIGSLLEVDVLAHYSGWLSMRWILDVCIRPLTAEPTESVETSLEWWWLRNPQVWMWNCHHPIVHSKILGLDWDRRHSTMGVQLLRESLQSVHTNSHRETDSGMKKYWIYFITAFRLCTILGMK